MVVLENPSNGLGSESEIRERMETRGKEKQEVLVAEW